MSDPARPLKWTDAMAMGIAGIDEQNQHLLEVFNRIARAQAEGVSQETMLACLDELDEYARHHFLEEERLIRHWRLDSSHRMMHLRAHESFRGFLRQARAFAGEHTPEVTVELLAFLAQWLLQHILEIDRRMAQQIQALKTGAVDVAALDPLDGARDDIARTASQFTEHLRQRTFALLGQRQQLTNLQSLCRALLHCSDVLIHSHLEQEMLESLCAALVQDTPFHTAWIARPGQSGEYDVLMLGSQGVEKARAAPRESTSEEAASVVIKAWNSQQPVVCNDTLADPTLQPWRAGFAERRRLSVLAVPIMRAGRMWAILVLASPQCGCFDAPMVEVCSRIVALLGRRLDELDAVDLAGSRPAQEAPMARTDTLTGLPNQCVLEEHLRQAVARARRRGEVLAVGVIDLDDFNSVNDQLGREAGNELLGCVSRRLLTWLRDCDFIARLGGDEFVVVVEDLEPREAMSQLGAALQRLHRAVETPFQLSTGQSVSIDMTMGVAMYPTDGGEPPSLLREASAAMYKAKQNRTQRDQWWSLGVATSSEPIAETPFDAFGSEAREFMSVLAPHMHPVAEKFSASFYYELESHPESAAVLACLSAAEYQALECSQAAHLRFLLDVHTTAQQVQETAQRLGAVHALIGISGAWMTRAMGMYRDLLRTHLDASLLTTRARYRALRAADARLQLDIEWQLQAMQSTLDQYQMLLARPMDAQALEADWIQGELDALAALPGIRAAVLLRPDVQNRLVFERAAGEGVASLVAGYRVRELYPTLDPRDVRGQGLVATTWLTGCQQETSAFAQESRSQPWQPLMREFGIRSAVTLPVHRRGAIRAVLMLFGAYPHQFASGWMHTWRLSLQNRWDVMTAATHSNGHAIDTSQAARIRSLLYGGGVEMFMQPIVNLADGTLVKVEALARLRTPEGAILVPGQFLPALGETDLDSLFRQGLSQGLAHVGRWRDENLDVQLSINLAPSSLVHPDCARWIEEALREAQVEPRHLTLELLESQELKASEVDEAITRLASMGVRIALDDLGAGFSNLKRLAQLPFHVIKIDQNIIKDLVGDPIKALSLIRTVVQIGHDLERDVVAEGLEDAGTIEAAMQLGCRLGQGYGLARPMPAAALAEWIRTRPVRGGGGCGLHSWIGALAFQWMVMHDALSLRLPGELASCPLTEFFEAQEIAEQQVLQWHRQIHEDPDESARLKAMQQMMQWMARRIREG